MPDPRFTSFLAVVELGSFTQAANALKLTQPAVSQHIRQLEEHLNVKLFDRSGKNLQLTPEGDIVLKYARRLETVEKNMERALVNYKLHRHSLKVGMSHTAESNLVPETLALYSARRADFSITLISDSIKNLYGKLKNYEIDLVIAEGRVADPDLRSLVLDTDHLVVIVSPRHPFANRNSVTLQELTRERLILRLPQSNTRKLFVNNLETQGRTIQDFNVIMELDNIAMIKDLIRRDIGISILARNTCATELRKGKLIALPIENMSMILEVNFIYTRDFQDQLLLDELTQIYRELAGKTLSGKGLREKHREEKE